MPSLAQKTVLITGASRGIGRAVALKAAQDGANVLFTYRSNEAAAQELLAELAGLGVEARALPLDVVDRGQVQQLAVEAKGFAGGVNCLVNNAGIREDAPLA